MAKQKGSKKLAGILCKSDNFAVKFPFWRRIWNSSPYFSWVFTVRLEYSYVIAVRSFLKPAPPTLVMHVIYRYLFMEKHMFVILKTYNNDWSVLTLH